MKKYKATKIVEAEIITAVEVNDGGDVTCIGENELSLNDPKGTPKIGDFLVKYDNSDYVSWCPKHIFEKHNAEISAEQMSFGDAIVALKCGFKVARQGWNGKNMFIFLREGRQIKGVDPKSAMGGDFESLPHLCMRTADGKCCVGWLASQTDILINDWMIVE